MSKRNLEIKALCSDIVKIRDILISKEAVFKGADHQIDTYFKVSRGRLKLREGNIENCLIYYTREDLRAPKASQVELFETELNSGLKQLLSKALGVLVSVKKRREIYFIGNVKFHLDEVAGLGSFLEIEVLGDKATFDESAFHKICRDYMELFGIEEKDLIEGSYSDLILKKQASRSS